MYLLDTNIVSELRRIRPNVRVLRMREQVRLLEWLKAVPTDQLFLSALTIGEIQAGIEITRAQLERILNLRMTRPIKEPIHIAVPADKAGGD